MVGIFKRFAKIGGAAAPEHHEALTSIAKSYTALVAATDFLEVSVSTLVIMVPNANICVI
jgi:nuclear pore complex protein Nup205